MHIITENNKKYFKIKNNPQTSTHQKTASALTCCQSLRRF